ncbi:protein of unknown function [Ruminococcaceae bacterium YRB3002]|nr:protein of unknown function [Ruminococcaceae bacterium YRB3002]
MDLTKILIDSMTSIDSISALTSRSKAEPSKIKAAVASALPGLIEALTYNSSTEEGAQALLGALSQHTNSGSMRSQLAGADLVDGDKILTKILGASKTDFISQVADIAGLDFNQTRTILSSISPALLSSVSAANNGYNAPGPRSSVVTLDPTPSTGPYAAQNQPITARQETAYSQPAEQPITAQAAAGPQDELSQLKEIVGNLIIDDEDRKIIEGVKGKSLLENLRSFLL